MKNFLSLIPGFRSNKLLKKIIAVIGYLFILIILLSSLSTGSTMGDKIITFVSYILILGIPFILITNFLSIRSKLPLFKSKKRGTSIVGSILVVVLMSFVISITQNLYSKEYKHEKELTLQSNLEKQKVKADEKENEVSKDKAIATAKTLEEQKIADEKAAEDKKNADAKAIEDKKIADSKSIEDKAIADAKAIEDQKIADAKAIEDKKNADAKAIEDKAIADAKAIEDQKVEKETKYNSWIESQFSAWDGSHTELVKLVKSNLNDKKSFEHDSTTYSDQGNYILIKMTYRAKNAFNATILQNITAKADYETNMLSIISQND